LKHSYFPALICNNWDGKTFVSWLYKKLRLLLFGFLQDKFSRLVNILPEIHAMAARGEEHLYTKHCAGSAPTQTLLMEMLHAKRKV